MCKKYWLNYVPSTDNGFEFSKDLFLQNAFLGRLAAVDILN